mmetsp:Transcript_8343/g.21959  ORF Transcript_8343/g.21959 Transcript_8343/m.21959 type:complete len:366 (+) Transcript_8343:1004-2101(+)
MEACTRRCVPSSQVSRSSSNHAGHWRPAAVDGLCRARVRGARLFIASQSRRAVVCNVLLLGFLLNHRWFCCKPHVSQHERSKHATGHTRHLLCVYRLGICSIFCSESGHGHDAINIIRAVPYARVHSVPVVWHVRAPHRAGCPPRRAAQSYRVSGAHKSHTSRDSTVAVWGAVVVVSCACGTFAVWRRVCAAHVCSQLFLAKSSVLHVWHAVSRATALARGVRRNVDRVDLFLARDGELPLVVVRFSLLCIQWFIHVHLCHCVLPSNDWRQKRGASSHQQLDLYLLLRNHFRGFRLDDRVRWLRRVHAICSPHLRSNSCRVITTRQGFPHARCVFYRVNSPSPVLVSIPLSGITNSRNSCPHHQA